MLLEADRKAFWKFFREFLWQIQRTQPEELRSIILRPEEEFDPLDLFLIVNLRKENVLHALAQTGDVQMIRTLQDEPFEEFQEDKSLWDTLCEKLPLQQDCDGNTPLHIAASKGYLDMVKAVIKYHADITVSDPIDVDKRTPLGMPCITPSMHKYSYITPMTNYNRYRPHHSFAERVVALLELRNYSGRDSSEEAYLAGEVETGEWLRIFRALYGDMTTELDGLDLPPTEEEKAQFWAATRRGYREFDQVFSILEPPPEFDEHNNLKPISDRRIDHSALYLSTNEQGQNYLHMAAVAGDVRFVECLSKVHFRHPHGETEDSKKMKEELPVQLDGDGCTPLHIAAIHGRLDFVKALLKHYSGWGEDWQEDRRILPYVEKRDIAGRTAAQAAHAAGAQETTAWLEARTKQLHDIWDDDDDDDLSTEVGPKLRYA